MATYIVLGRFTQEGIKDVRSLRQFVEQNRSQGERLGAKAIGWYLTMGEYDFVVVVEAPDDETMAAQTLGVLSRGRSRTQTMRAFTLDEVEAIAQKLG